MPKDCQPQISESDTNLDRRICVEYPAARRTEQRTPIDGRQS